jgi:L-alanine-DL-glutamate epimerase-like enolase superfamily enzyme
MDASHRSASTSNGLVDYNQSLSVAEAIRRVQLLEGDALVWVEEPTRADDSLAMLESQRSAGLRFRLAKISGGRTI